MLEIVFWPLLLDISKYYSVDVIYLFIYCFIWYYSHLKVILYMCTYTYICLHLLIHQYLHSSPLAGWFQGKAVIQRVLKLIPHH